MKSVSHDSQEALVADDTPARRDGVAGELDAVARDARPVTVVAPMLAALASLGGHGVRDEPERPRGRGASPPHAAVRVRDHRRARPRDVRAGAPDRGLIDHVGRTPALASGLCAMAASTPSSALAGQRRRTAILLFGLGIGWNLSLVAATAQLADRTSPRAPWSSASNDPLAALLGAGGARSAHDSTWSCACPRVPRSASRLPGWKSGGDARTSLASSAWDRAALRRRSEQLTCRPAAMLPPRRYQQRASGGWLATTRVSSRMEGAVTGVAPALRRMQERYERRSCVGRRLDLVPSGRASTRASRRSPLAHCESDGVRAQSCRYLTPAVVPMHRGHSIEPPGASAVRSNEASETHACFCGLAAISPAGAREALCCPSDRGANARRGDVWRLTCLAPPERLHGASLRADTAGSRTWRGS